MIHGQLGHLLSSALSLRRNVQIPREQKMSHLVNIWIHKVFTVFSQTLSHVVLMTILWREKGGFSFPWLSLPSLLLALFSPLPSLFFPFLFLSTAFFFLFFFFSILSQCQVHRHFQQRDKWSFNTGNIAVGIPQRYQPERCLPGQMMSNLRHGS